MKSNETSPSLEKDSPTEAATELQQDQMNMFLPVKDGEVSDLPGSLHTMPDRVRVALPMKTGVFCFISQQ
jgi:hypothetical protein